MRYYSMIVVTDTSGDVIIDLRGEPVTAVLTGELKGNFKVEKYSEIITSTNDRYTAVDSTFFDDVNTGDYTFSVYNSNNDLIYTERLKKVGQEAIETTSNDIKFEHKVHEI